MEFLYRIAYLIVFSCPAKLVILVTELKLLLLHQALSIVPGGTTLTNENAKHNKILHYILGL